MATGSVTAGDVVEALDGAGHPARLIGDAVTPIDGATHDSRLVTVGSLFVCLRGERHDGHDYAGAAAEAGAAVLLVDHPVDVAEACQIVVDDTRRAAGVAASCVAGEPSRAMTTVGITGTNGKTTTAQLVATILDGVGRSTGVIGTLHGTLTTPEATELQAGLARFRDTGREAVVMEVSSHALALHRVDGTTFDVVAFTNFGHDHLDLHGTMEEYFRAKSRLFDTGFSRFAVINVDDPHGRLLADAVTGRGDGVEVVEVAPSELGRVRVEADHHRYVWRGLDVVVPIGGDFNVANSLIALTIAAELGVEPGDAVAAIAAAPVVPGRFERIRSAEATRRGITVIVDFAHTPEGLEQLFTSARSVAGPTGRVLAVFGAGGDRDRPKRPEMGATVSRLVDRIIVTSDNPRNEDPVAIIGDVLEGIGPEYREHTSSDPDRRAAILSALVEARRGDLVVIAGRGHEATQDLGSEIIDFDDRVVARELLASLSGDAATPTTHEDTP